MLLDEYLQNLQKSTHKKPPTYEKIAKVLDLGSKQAVSNRIYRQQPLKDIEIELLDAEFKNNNQSTQKTTSIINDRIEINYWEYLPEELKNPKIQSVWFDREIIENAWGMSADHLCIVPMVGDKMTTFWYTIRSGELLIVDLNQNHIMGNGVYFATSRNNTRFWIREMQALINDDIQIKGYAPSGETTKLFTKKQLDEVGFKIIGKVIKNVSFRL